MPLTPAVTYLIKLTKYSSGLVDPWSLTCCLGEECIKENEKMEWSIESGKIPNELLNNVIGQFTIL